MKIFFFFFFNRQGHLDNDNSEGHKKFLSDAEKNPMHVVLKSKVGMAVNDHLRKLCYVGLSYLLKMGYMDLEAA